MNGINIRILPRKRKGHYQNYWLNPKENHQRENHHREDEAVDFKFNLLI